MTHNIQLEKNQTDCHFCFWDGLIHWLHNSINRRCFCTFHALRSQRNHWATTEGSPYYYQLAESAGKCDTAERRRRASLGTNTEEEWRSQPESRIRTFLCEVQTSADSCLFCSQNVQSAMRSVPFLILHRFIQCCTCSGELCLAWCCSTWGICTPPVLVWAANFQWTLWLRFL